MSTREPTYATQLVRPFRSLLQGYPQVPAALKGGDSPADDARVPVAAGQAFLQHIVELTGDEDVGLRAARQTQVGAFDVLEFAAFSAPTWRAAVETSFRYVRLMNEAADFRIEVDGGAAHLVLGSRVPLVRAGIDFQSGALHRTTIHWVDEEAPELQVWLTYPRPADTRQHVETFGDVHFRFDAPHNGFVFDAARLDHPVRSADPASHRLLREHLERMLGELSAGEGLVEGVRAQLLASLKGGPLGAEALAAEMGITRRTLSRRLAQHGTTFSKLLAEVRHHAAVDYLVTTRHSVDDIAFLLGFSESSAFVRAFQRWQGEPPAAYRRRRARGAG